MKNYRRNGMGILSLNVDERVKNVSFTEDTISVDLMDGRTISTPLMWYPRLFHASATKLANWKVSGGGYGKEGRRAYFHRPHPQREALVYHIKAVREFLLKLEITP
jgi:hypothetical protein